MRAVLKLSEPFTAVDIAEVTEMNLKNAGNFITRWKTKGWLKKSSYGKYERTKAFGGAVNTESPGKKLLEEIHSEIDQKKPGSNYD